MAQRVGRGDRHPIEATGVWLEEHDWLHTIFRSAENRSPRFRFPDLLSACVSLVVGSESGQRQLVQYLVTQLTLRDPTTERRSCDIWREQFEQLMSFYGGGWNRFPNPQYGIDHITTACVAVARALPDGKAQVLRQARVNLLARARAGGLTTS